MCCVDCVRAQSLLCRLKQSARENIKDKKKVTRTMLIVCCCMGLFTGCKAAATEQNVGRATGKEGRGTG